MQSEPDVQGVFALQQRYCDAVNRRDWDGFESTFAEDGRWVIPAAGIDMRGRGEIRRFNEAHFGNCDYIVMLIGSQHVERCTGEVANGFTVFQSFQRQRTGAGTELRIVLLYQDTLRWNGERWEFTERLGQFLLREERAAFAPPPLPTFD
jgi:ketosteroid isomerase-like protein